MEKYRFLEHKADIKFQATGNSLEELFINSFEALKECMTDKVKIKKKIKRKIKIKGKDLNNLLYKFLEEFLFLFDAKNFIASGISNIKIDYEKFSLIAEVFGDKESNYNLSNDIKAVTYNSMFTKFNKKDKKWVCQVVLDA